MKLGSHWSINLLKELLNAASNPCVCLSEGTREASMSFCSGFLLRFNLTQDERFFLATGEMLIKVKDLVLESILLTLRDGPLERGSGL